MPLSKLREEGCGASEAPGGAITHKIKLNLIIELKKGHYVPLPEPIQLFSYIPFFHFM